MLILTAKNRQILGKKVKNLRKKGILPGTLYGPKIEKPISIEVDSKEFEGVYQEAGESSLVSLELQKEKFLVLVHEIERESIFGKIIHVDFYQPRLDEETEVTIPLIFEGEEVTIKRTGGTLVKNIHEVEVRALPKNLPHEIKVNIEKLKTFEDAILIKDLIVPKGVKILKDPEEIVALVVPLEDIEEEFKKPISLEDESLLINQEKKVNEKEKKSKKD